jgi:hypothetical protein
VVTLNGVNAESRIDYPMVLGDDGRAFAEAVRPRYQRAIEASEEQQA